MRSITGEPENRKSDVARLSLRGIFVEWYFHQGMGSLQAVASVKTARDSVHLESTTTSGERKRR
jgi:hypothetical protein